MSLGEWALITVGAVAASSTGVVLVRKYVDSNILRDHHEATDHMMACVGTLFAILLGFMVANAMTRFEEARINVQEEAGAAGDIFRLSRGLPPPTNMVIMTDCVKYFDGVADEEFRLMEDGKMSDKCWQIYSDLWQHCTSYDPKTQGQSNLHQGLVEAMTKLGECPCQRAAQIQSHIPIVLWLVVGIGAIVTVSFSFFFGLDSVKLQLAMTALLTYVLCMNISLLISFNDPFSGDVKIKPIAFVVNQTLFRKALGEHVK